ncbi:MAG: EpsI family protein [Acidobacteria bacterium]|nr:EpsI family protein [Acidobacteriota bacterium]
MTARWRYVLMLSVLLLTAGVTQFLTRASDRERVPAHAALVEFPAQLDFWRQVDAQTLGAGQLRELRADDYLSRTYANDRGALAYLFIAYYASQRHRQTIHSPQNCMPGSGWTMSGHRLHRLGNAALNEYLIEKDGARMLAFYWYHGRGRAVASEYWARWRTIEDAALRGRTDGALIRVVVPMAKGDDADVVARAAGLDFVQRVLPSLSSFIPD